MSKFRPNEADSAQRRTFIFLADNTDPTGQTGKTGLGGTPGSAIKVGKDLLGSGPTVGDSAGALTEVDATNLPGFYYYTYSQAELAANGKSQIVTRWRNTGLLAGIIPLTAVDDIDPGDNVIRAGIAQAGAASTITLDASASATDRFYNALMVRIIGGTGQGQVRRITNYVGSTKVASVFPVWVTNPDSTSVFYLEESIREFDVIRQGLAQGGASGTITLDSGASAVDNIYNFAIIHVVSGTGAGQVRQILSYVGSTKVATMEPAWSTAPDNTSVFVIMAVPPPNVELLTANHVGQGTFGEQQQEPSHKAVTGTLTATAFSTDLTESTTDHWKDAFCRFVTGALAGQVKKITGYNGSTKVLSFTSGFTGAPSNNDRFVIVNG